MSPILTELNINKIKDDINLIILLGRHQEQIKVS